MPIVPVVMPYPQHSINSAHYASNHAAKDTSDNFPDRASVAIALPGSVICALHNALSLHGKRHRNESQDRRD
jgi:hypothetical protein